MQVRDVHLRHLDLFRGVGMFSLAARWAGIETIAASEISEYANRVAAVRFPAERNLGDIRNLCRRVYDCDLSQYDDEGIAWCERCEAEFGECACVGTDEFTDCYGFPDIITAGSPCQDFSLAGKGEGIDGARGALIHEAIRVTRELQPLFLVIENVAGIKSRGADQVLAALDAEGYACEPFVVGARNVGAWHRRERVFFVAHRQGERMEGLRAEGIEVSHTLAPAFLPYRACDGEWQVEPDLRRVPDGNAAWMDRLQCVGNSVVPHVPVMLFDFMRDVTRSKRFAPATTP